MAIYRTQQYTGKGGANDADRISFETAEHNKLMASIDAEDAARKKRMEEIMARQKANFSKPSPTPTNPVVPDNSVTKPDIKGDGSSQTDVSSVENEVTPTASIMSVDDFLTNNSNYFRRRYFDKNSTVTIAGKKYPVIVARGALGRNGEDGLVGINGNSFYAYDEETGNLMELQSKLKGQLNEHQTPGKWFNITKDSTSTGNPTHVTYSQTSSNLPGGGITYRKQGGTMNRINYFQQGGTAPQANIQEQVIALVQAAMQGDQEANNTIEQIMAKAKSGDPQATQLAQMIQAVAQEMQSQATMAKWGSKLGYIRSLKYARGGKTCKACQDGEKIEMEACGGKAKKKAKKKYFGGWI